MGNSVASVKYGSWVTDPVPQVGYRDNIARIGDKKYGPGVVECVVTFNGVVEGSTHNEIEGKIATIRAEMAKGGQTLYWHDGTTVRLNGTAQPISFEVPPDWAQYEARYTCTFIYYPKNETHYNHGLATVSYNGYTFSPIPVLGREYTPNRESARATRKSSTMTVTLQGFIDGASYAANKTSMDALITACSGDGTLQYGSWTQACRFVRLTQPPDVGDITFEYTLVVEYDLDYAGDGVLAMESTRTIQSSERDAIDYVPFLDDAQIQRLGRNAQVITARGYVEALTLAEARTAAAAEILLQFPGVFNTDCVETQRDITENASAKKVEWNVTRIYPIPLLTGGVYGALPTF